MWSFLANLRWRILVAHAIRPEDDPGGILAAINRYRFDNDLAPMLLGRELAESASRWAAILAAESRLDPGEFGTVRIVYSATSRLHVNDTTLGVLAVSLSIQKPHELELIASKYTHFGSGVSGSDGQGQSIYVVDFGWK